LFKVIVAGSRDFNNYELLKRKLDVALANKVSEGITIISGAARGADKLGERYAAERGYDLISKPADWDTYGKRAGYIRNEEMAKIADALVAFWDGKSRGTYHMINIAKRYNLPTIVVNYVENKTYKLTGGKTNE
jgi:YspA, cpYpsA-related SLOG family